jgi:4-amino-4-deoxy-L-arabinose transferase-like glycosyltransferase
VGQCPAPCDLACHRVRHRAGDHRLLPSTSGRPLDNRRHGWLTTTWPNITSTRLRAAAAVTVLALLTRLGYFLVIRGGSLTAPDSVDYLSLAARLAHDGRYASPGAIFPADLNRPPGYPVLLALTNVLAHISLQRVALIQILLGAAFAGGLTCVVGRWLGSRYGLVAGLAMALDWSTVLYTPLILADALFAMVFATGIALVVSCLVRRSMRDAVLGGAALGLATLLKPAGIVALIAVALAICVKPRANWRAVPTIIVCGLVVLPWAVRNDDRYGIFTLSTIDTVNLYFYTAEGVAHEPLFFRQPPALSAADLALPRFREARGNASQLNSRLRSQAWEEIRSHLPKAVLQELWGVLHVVLGTGKDTLANSTRDQRIPAVIGTVLPLGQLLLMWLLAVVGTVTAWRRRTIQRTVLVLLVAATLAIILPAGGPVGNSRFRLPVMPIVCVLAALGWGALWKDPNRRGPQTVSVASGWPLPASELSARDPVPDSSSQGGWSGIWL